MEKVEGGEMYSVLWCIVGKKSGCIADGCVNVIVVGESLP